jgi:hypothetical protein
MKLTTLAAFAIIASPFTAYADSSQPNSAPGLEGRPLTNQGEGTTGMASDRNYPGQRGIVVPGATGTTDAGKTGFAGTRGATDSSIPGATNPNEPIGARR